jgi:hypothetical protein
VIGNRAAWQTGLTTSGEMKNVATRLKKTSVEIVQYRYELNNFRQFGGDKHGKARKEIQVWGG